MPEIHRNCFVYIIMFLKEVLKYSEYNGSDSRVLGKCVRVRVCVSVCVSACMCECMCVCVHVSQCVCACECHVYTYDGVSLCVCVHHLHVSKCMYMCTSYIVPSCVLLLHPQPQSSQTC